MKKKDRGKPWEEDGNAQTFYLHRKIAGRLEFESRHSLKFCSKKDSYLYTI